MAKDGTIRGGARPGAGRKRKDLDEKLLDGQSAQFIPSAFETPSEEGLDDIPEPSEYLKAQQKAGIPLKAEEIYKDTYRWLKSLKCHKLVSKSLVEQYSMMYARYVACEELISKSGYLYPHPTTGKPVATPYAGMSREYSKQANICWMQIYAIVKENASENYLGDPDDEMEILLRKKKR